MLETREVEVNPETSKNEIIDTTSSTNSSLKTSNNNLETLTVKPKMTSTKFELHIMNAYKKLTGLIETNPEIKNKDKKAQKALQEAAEKLNISECETELRKASEELESLESISLNKNLIDKIVRISKRNKINLSLVVGHIYIQLMYKKNLFSKLNQKNSLDRNLIISFINELINMCNLLKNTYLGVKYENTLFCFLENIIKEIAFDSEQLN